MSPQAPTTDTTGSHRPVTPPAAGPSRSDIDLLTLTITAIASAAAAYICSRFWAAGTLPAAASMPVLVALIKEGLRRPTEAVVVSGGRVRTERRPIVHHWKIAAATGLAGFALFAIITTTMELLAGRAASGGKATTLFGGTRTVVVRESTVTVKEAAPQVTTVLKETPGKTTTVTTPAPAAEQTQTTPTTPTQPAPTTTTTTPADPAQTPTP